MSFRIVIDPETSAELRAFSPHVVLQIGHALAELAEAASTQHGPLQLASGRLEIEGGAVLYDVDHAAETVRVTHLELSPTPDAVLAEAGGNG